MSAHVLLNLLDDLGEKDKFSPTRLINLLVQEHECRILFII